MVDKIDPSIAAGLYKNTQGIGQGLKVEGNDGPNFGDLIKKAATDSIDTMRAGEKASADAVVGTADLTDVVEAVTAAELTLQTVVAVRDRMLNAYQEIMRLPI
ncbi:MAG: flagellar hook-basal body complex protein FliE [Sinomicrobium sp.]|nr:flagellar hook-basal body complex protein FliE [Sinomicrobium sp.]MCB9996488.1 flagellar hook-basal body complex protein FliE [Rhodospirillales bacterium]